MKRLEKILAAWGARLREQILSRALGFFCLRLRCVTA